MLNDSLAMEHYRLHIIEQWPDGAKKDTALASVHSSLQSLLQGQGAQAIAWTCIVCGTKPPAKDQRVLRLAA